MLTGELENARGLNLQLLINQSLDSLGGGDGSSQRFTARRFAILSTSDVFF